MSAVFTDTASALLHGQQSDIGKRPNQEDRWEVREFTTADGRPATLALIADGIGGHSTGEIASQMAKEQIPARLLARPPSASEITSRLKTTLEEVSQAIYQASLEDPNRSGMGTTCTAIAVADRRLYLAHVGDSRLYLLRNGQIYQLTIDHTWAEEAIRAGRPPEEIRNHPNRGVILRYLGIDPTVSIDTRYRDITGEIADALAGPFFLEPGDTLLLCTDGLSDVLDNRTIAGFMAYPDCQTAADALVSAALRAGTTDNVTAVVLRLPGGAIVPPAAAVQAGRKLPLLAVALGAIGLVALALVALLVLSRGRGAVETTSMPPPAAATTTRVPQATLPAPVARTAAAGGGGLQVATAVPTRTTMPTAAATLPVVTATVEATAMAAAMTPPPTLIPTATSAPTRAPATAGPAVTPSPAPLPAAQTGGGVDLLEPAEGEKITDRATFKWRPQADLKLEPGQQYELIVWGEGEDPMRAGRSPVGGTSETQASANLAGLEGPLGLSPGRTYLWGVRLLAADGKTPLRMLSVGRKFVYERSGSQSGSAPKPPDK